MPEQFISEPIQPVPGSFDTRFMTGGVPGLPREFFWRGEKLTVSEVLRTWRTTGPCRHGSKEQYARRHWFEIKTASSGIMKIYFDKGTHGKRKEMGWFLFTID
ncbi:MAG: DUF6504 family protein [Candidatus Omnitrophota bacterium]|jgi:phosphoribosylglycinamide formyltransferase-1